MNEKSNRAMFGIILILIALYVIGRRYLSMGYGHIPALVGGLALLLLFHTKRKRWALFIGTILTFKGILDMFSGSPIGNGLSDAAIFIVPSFIFLTMYFNNRSFGYLTPGCTLFWLGVIAVLRNLSFVTLSGDSLMLLCAGLTFVSIYVLSRNTPSSKRWPLSLGSILLVIFIISLAGYPITSALFSLAPIVTCVLLLIGGGYLVFSSLKK